MFATLKDATVDELLRMLKRQLDKPYAECYFDEFKAVCEEALNKYETEKKCYDDAIAAWREENKEMMGEVDAYRTVLLDMASVMKGD